MFKRIIVVCTLFLAMGTATAKQFLDKIVAIVNDGVITASELDKQVDLSKKQMIAQKIQLPKESILRKKALQQLIDSNLQMQMAKQNKISVDNVELNSAIERIAKMNNLTLAQLREELSKQNINWEEYKKNIHKEILINHIQQKAVGKDIVITNEQVKEYLKTAPRTDDPTLTYHLKNIVVLLPEKPTAEQVKKAKNKANQLVAALRKTKDFSQLALKEKDESTAALEIEDGDLGERHLAELPALFAKEVIHMKIGQIVGPLRAGNGFQLIKLVALGGNSQSQNHIVTLTHVRHILLKPEANVLASESLKQINNMYQQLKSGKDFSSMAKTYSLDATTAVKGGDLGWVAPGELVPEFEKAMNDLPLHKISRPIKTQFGWHFIEVLARKRKDDSVAFKKQQARQLLQQRKFIEAVQNWQQHIRSEAYIHIVDKALA